MTQVSRLAVTENGQQKIYVLHKPVIDIGGGSQNDVVLLDGRVSRRHARIAREGETWRVEDLNSANGTRLNGMPVTTPVDVSAQDVITIGSASLSLAWAEAPALDDSPSLLQTAQISTQADLDQTLSEQPLEAAVRDTSLPRVAVRFEGRTWEETLRGEQLTIGRAPDNGIVLPDEKVSPQHALLERREERVFLRDQHSSNGTFVDGERVEQRELRGREDIRIGGARLTFKPAFTSEHLAPVDHPSYGASTRRPVVFVPGFLGSQLWRGDDLLWPDMRDFISHPESFSLPLGNDLLPRGVVNEIIVVPNFIKLEQYTRLVHFLTDSLGYQEGKDLHVFAYDWRKDLRKAARLLAAEIETFRQSLDDPSRPVTILAHSMGCLVTRYYIDRLGGDRCVERAVLMGGPHLGIPKFIVAILAGLSVLPFGMMGERLRQVVASFPSAYQTLPTYPCVFDERGNPIDIFADERWLPESSRAYLKDGFAFRGELSPHSRVPTTCIFGYGSKTVSKVLVRLLPDGHWSNPQFVEENNGDNTIPDASAILHGADIHPVHQQHGALYTDSDVKMHLKLELTRP